MVLAMSQVTQGEGYSVANLDDLGDGPGFRKIRPALGVEEFGINAVVMPPGIESSFHYHADQEELYFVHSGELEIQFGDGTVHKLGPGGVARVAAATHRQTRNRGSEDVVYVIVGAKGGYVGRDGRRPDYDTGATARPIES
jgi:mannose-6-phosphate isomerase-like protein (cupin superfamily)